MPTDKLTVICFHCRIQIYRVQRQQVVFPLDYRNFEPYHDGIDQIFEDPICPFCDRPFQITRNDINWSKVASQPIVTTEGIFSADGQVTEGEPLKCQCGCGENIPDNVVRKYLNKQHGINHKKELARFEGAVK